MFCWSLYGYYVHLPINTEFSKVGRPSGFVAIGLYLMKHCENKSQQQIIRKKGASAMEKYIASYDIGTSGVKIALLDLEGNVKGIATESYRLITPAPGWAEQDPMDHWNAVCKVTKEALKKASVSPETVVGLVFNTQWKGIIPVDKDGNVLHNAIIWLDGRGGDQAEKINQRLNRPGFLCERDY